jgi:hypothetical protein
MCWAKGFYLCSLAATIGERASRGRSLGQACDLTSVSFVLE